MNEKNNFTKKELRQFGVISAVIVTLLFGTLIPWLRGHQPPGWPFILAGVFLVTGLALPSLLGPVLRVWLKFGHVMGYINTKLILTLVFFLIFTPCAMIMKVIGRDILHRKLDKNLESYKIPSHPIKIDNMEKPF